MGSLALLQGILPTQGSNPGLLHCRQIVYQLSHKGPSRTNTKKRCPFHYRGLECKSRKSRNTWSNRQMWPWNTALSRAKANRVLLRERTGHSKHPLPTTKTKLYTRTSPDGQHQNEIDYILCSQRWRSSISQQKQDRELTVAQIMNSLLPNSD